MLNFLLQSLFRYIYFLIYFTGYYMYIETSSPRQKGDYANLELSVYGNGAPACLKFYYHMYGSTMGSLTVFNEWVAVFNVSGNQGNYWRQAKIDIRLRHKVSSCPHDVLFDAKLLSRNTFNIVTLEHCKSVCLNIQIRCEGFFPTRLET